MAKEGGTSGGTTSTNKCLLEMKKIKEFEELAK
uniref:Uncharacterized protein n=1 Tax=Panagrolaimus sp. ES5 TaxID=591445 RepID=A0AC34GB98_9BILA